MTLLFLEGAGVDMSNWDGNSCVRSTSPLGRYGDTGIVGHSDTANTVYRNITPSAEVYVGFAHLATTNSPNGGNRVVSFLGDAGATEHVRVWLPSINEVRVSRIDGTQLATYVVPGGLQNKWFYYEVYFKIADSGGRCTVKMNGSTVMDFTGDTKNGGTSTNVDRVSFTGTGGSAASYTDDFYICNALGSAPWNTFAGELRVLPSLPNGVGSSTQLTPTGSANNWDNVNDIPVVDTTYNASPTVGLRDTYAMADISTTGSVLGVQVSTRMAKSDAGAVNMKAAVKSGATVAYGATRSVQATPVTYQDIWETNPNTGTAWSVATFNSLEVGAEVA